MADQSRKSKEFPDVASKLAAPTKKSQFERQKAEAEAKRLREEAEAAAVYEDFVKSFADEDDIPSSDGGSRFGDSSSRGPGRGSFGAGFGGGPQRHFSASGSQRKSGPGTLPGSMVNPSVRKRPLETSFQPSKEKEHGLFKYEEASGPLDVATAFQQPEDEEESVQLGNRAAEKPAVKPALHLTSLPPQTSVAFIESLLPQHLNVEHIRVQPPAASGSTERRTTAAIVTLAKDTPVSAIDAEVNKLQNKYLGSGFYLSIARSFSTATINSAGLGALSNSLPFGAKPGSNAPQHALNRAPPPESLRHGFPPPANYDSPVAGHFGRGSGPVFVHVKPPIDVAQLKLIHKTIEMVHEHGPRAEALLMTLPEVKRDPKWAWIWDARSQGGVYYRWRLYEIFCEAYHRGQNWNVDEEVRIFDSTAPWVAPARHLQFEFNTEFESFVDDSDYNSSDEGDSGDETVQRRPNKGGAPKEQDPEDVRAFITPIQRAKLTHLVTRLPATVARLRRGDVARVTYFAIFHASSGADEIVSMLITNVERPFCLSAILEARRDAGDSMEVEEDGEKKQEKEELLACKLVALFLISDLLKASSTSGVHQAWRYRLLFENAFKQRKVFEGLGRLEKELQMGRMSAERWKSRIKSLLDLWEQWSLFTSEAQKQFSDAFHHPPLTEAEKAAAVAEEKKKKAEGQANKSRWKPVDGSATEASQSPASSFSKHQSAMDMDIDKPQVKEVRKVPAKADTIKSDAMEGRIRGSLQKRDDGRRAETKSSPSKIAKNTAAPASSSLSSESPATTARRKRPRAVDMFGDSDED